MALALISRYASPLYGPAHPFYSGDGSSTLVPFPFPVSVGGHPYLVQWEKDAIEIFGGRFKRDTLPLLRQQADQSSEPGEQSISPEQFWRRSQDSWENGAGQSHLDRQNSIGHRFNTSKGLDCWTEWQLKLLNDTALKKSSANTNLYCVTTGSKVYLMDSTSIRYSTDLTSWSDVTGVSATAGSSICTDGTTLYVANGADGIYTGAVSGTSVTSTVTGTVSLIRYVKGRLMAAGGNSLYNITTLSGAVPTALLTKSGWTWVDIVGGQSQIYAACYSGDKSLIYRTAIVADGTALGAPIVAGELPDGEIVRSLGAYLGYILIGSDVGVRFCSVNSDGSLQIGSLIPTTSPVYCFEGQSKFVWYGLTNYDSTSTGLGRMNLENFTAPLTPAFASDIMATTQGAVRSVATFNNYRLFSVDGHGLYAETLNTPVATGSLTTGKIGYTISDTKVAMFIDLKFDPLHGYISIGLASNDGSVASLGSVITAGTTVSDPPISANQASAEEFELTITLTPVSSVSPVLTRWTLRSYPTPKRTAQWDIPIILKRSLIAGGVEYSMDVATEHDFLDALHANQNIVNLQVGTQIKQVTLYDSQWLPDHVNELTGEHEGLFYGQFREIAG